jgi:hypothetical protein
VRRASVVLLAVLTLGIGLATASVPSAVNENGCTIGVAAGTSTADGRPLLWKTRDEHYEPDNGMHYETSSPLHYISVINAGEPWHAWMGVNEKGFAILNSTSYDLPPGFLGLTNGALMELALGTCATVAQFQALLDSTNVTSRRTQANFAVIDSTGAAALFETGGRVYWKFDAHDTSVAPNGYIIRTNFAINGGGFTSWRQYNRSVNIVGDLWAGDTLSHRSILRHQMRDFSNFSCDPFPVPYAGQMFHGVPYGYIYTTASICKARSVSATAIQGVLPGESAKLSTMWTMLGQPAAAIAVPYWPVGDVPREADGGTTAPLCDASLGLKSFLFTREYVPEWHMALDFVDTYALLDESGQQGVWAQTFAVEDSILGAADSMLGVWRTMGLATGDMLEAEAAFAGYALQTLRALCDSLFWRAPLVAGAPLPAASALRAGSYPDPFHEATTICYSVIRSGPATVSVFDVAGRRVRELVNAPHETGCHEVVWDARDDCGASVTSGVYFYRIRTRDSQHTGRVVLTR